MTEHEMLLAIHKAWKARRDCGSSYMGTLYEYDNKILHAVDDAMKGFHPEEAKVEGDAKEIVARQCVKAIDGCYCFVLDHLYANSLLCDEKIERRDPFATALLSIGVASGILEQYLEKEKK